MDPMALEMRRGLALLHELQGRPRDAESILRDVLRIRQAELPTDDPDLAETRIQLARVLLAMGKFAESEPLARASLAAFDALDRDDWRRYSAESVVGGCRLAAGDLAGAETPLERGYEGLAARANRIPAIEQFRLREALTRLTGLFTTLNRPTESARWQQQLVQFDQSPAGRKLKTARGFQPAL